MQIWFQYNLGDFSIIIYSISLNIGEFNYKSLVIIVYLHEINDFFFILLQ